MSFSIMYIERSTAMLPLFHNSFPQKEKRREKVTSRSVKLGSSTLVGGNRRRSPRISGLDSGKSDPDSGSRYKFEKPVPPCGPATPRDRIKRKRHQLHAVSSSITEVSQVDDVTFGKDEPPNCSDDEASIIPEKKVLEHILDTLQRRDIYEIFAEPVDPDEVVDYYEIINEPMDFGTMRAKLHEGMYENLEQFKHDVFLITENAMHFNSSSTIYFRQARAIHELSKRVFHVLETDPKTFESEFLGSRRRSTRRPHNESKVCRFSAEIKPTSPKDTPNSVAASDSVHERNSRETPKPPIVASHGNTRRNNGAKDGRWSNNIETDRRCSYERPQKWFFHNSDNIFHSKCLELEPILDFNYRESLLLFVKDLGPTAQMIATRRIQRLQENPSCNWMILQETTNYQEPIAHASHMSLKLTDSVSVVSSGKEEILECSEGPGDPNRHSRGKLVQNHKETEKFLGGSDSTASCSVILSKKSTAHHHQMVDSAGKLDENVRPVILALEHSRANSWDSKSRNKKIGTSRSNQVVAVPPATEEKKGAEAVSTGFTFDMNFLKAKLNQMKVVVGKDKQPTSTYQNGFRDDAISNNSTSFPNKESRDTLDTDLALQL